MTVNDDEDDQIAQGIRRHIDRLFAEEPSRRPSVLLATPAESTNRRVRSRVARRELAPILVAGVALLLVALVFQRPTSIGTGSGSQLREIARVKLPGPVYDLAIDAPRNALWFAYMAPDSDDALYRYDIASGTLSQWPLPPTDHNGFLERVAVAPDGGIWVTEEYSIVRFDPSASTMATHTFAEADSDATAGALSPNDPSPGTWPASIAFDTAGNTLVSRHNVRSLVRLDAELHVLASLKLPAEMAGPGDLIDVDGLIYAAPYAGFGNTVIFSESGTIRGSAAAGTVRFATRDGQVFSVGSGGLVAISQSAEVSRLLPSEGSPNDRVAPTADGAVVYLDGAGLIEEVSRDGTAIASMTLVNVPVVVGNPKGVPVTAYSRDEVGAIASDSRGSIWYVDVTAQDLVQLQR